MAPVSDQAPTERKDDRTFHCQNVRASWHENISENIGNYRLSSAMVRPNAKCSAAQMLTHGSTQQCNSNAYAPPEWARTAMPSSTETKCSSSDRSMNSDVMM